MAAGAAGAEHPSPIDSRGWKATGVSGPSVIVIGAGPAGLSVAYELIRRGVEPLVLESGSTPGASFAAFPRNIFFGPWLNNLLPGSNIDWAWLLKRSTQPAYTRYLQDYAHQNRLGVKTDVRVEKVTRTESGFTLDTSKGSFSAPLLVNATGYWSRPYVPPFEGLQSTSIPFIHVSRYRDPATVRELIGSNRGRVLVVGKRLSAGETMTELHRAGFEVSLSFRGPLVIGPSVMLEALLSPVQWIVERINVAMRRKIDSFPPMAGGESRRLLQSGAVAQYAAPARFNSHSVVFEDGREASFDLVIFATGYKPALDHLSGVLPSVDNEPPVRSMESTECPGLFFLGLNGQRTYRSRFLRGIVEDSRYLAELVARRARRLPVARREGIQVTATANQRATSDR